MSDVDSIEIIKYNALDSLSLNVQEDISNISIDYQSNVNSIAVAYDNEIENITLSLGSDIQSVYSVNTLVGNVNLTYTDTLLSGTASGGIYSHNVTHNLNYSSPIVAVYDTYNRLVIADISIMDTNSVTIKAAINLLGYKVVVQR